MVKSKRSYTKFTDRLSIRNIWNLFPKRSTLTDYKLTAIRDARVFIYSPVLEPDNWFPERIVVPTDIDAQIYPTNRPVFVPTNVIITPQGISLRIKGYQPDFKVISFQLGTRGYRTTERKWTKIRHQIIDPEPIKEQVRKLMLERINFLTNLEYEIAQETLETPIDSTATGFEVTKRKWAEAIRQILDEDPENEQWRSMLSKENNVELSPFMQTLETPIDHGPPRVEYDYYEASDGTLDNLIKGKEPRKVPPITWVDD